MSMKLPEGIGFTADDFFCAVDSLDNTRSVVEIANAKLPSLFQEWCKREGLKMHMFYQDGMWWAHETELIEKDTHQAYLMLPTEIKK